MTDHRLVKGCLFRLVVETMDISIFLTPKFIVSRHFKGRVIPILWSVSLSENGGWMSKKKQGSIPVRERGRGAVLRDCCLFWNVVDWKRDASISPCRAERRGACIEGRPMISSFLLFVHPSLYLIALFPPILLHSPHTLPLANPTPFHLSAYILSFPLVFLSLSLSRS